MEAIPDPLVEADAPGIDPDARQVGYPIRFGSIAWSLGGAASSTKTHKWTLFLRGAANEALPFVRSVEFHLHESFPEPIRLVSQAPFEVHDTGWGEFQTKIVVHFIDDQEEPVVLVHTLRLYPLDGKPTKAPVVSEVADEIMFINPSPMMEAALLQNSGSALRALPHPALGEREVLEGQNADEGEAQMLRDAIRAVKNRILMAKDQFDVAEAEASQLRQRLEELIRQHGAVYGNDEIKLWKPEDFRHVPMVSTHDASNASKKKRVMDVVAAATPESESRSKKKSKSSSKKKKKR